MFNDQGIPLGSNGGMSVAFSKMFKFALKLGVDHKNGQYNSSTGQWTGFFADVSKDWLLALVREFEYKILSIKVFCFQVISGDLDMVIAEIPYKLHFLKKFDMSNYFSTSEVMFTVCEPKRIKGTFNVLGPFGYQLMS